jgi:poly-beta-1,6-N-acetyl-D-glucosamine N-deacetylase
MVRALVFRLLRFSFLPDLIRHTVQRRRVTILLYHKPDVETLERHLGALRRRYSIISLRTFLDQFSTPQTSQLPERPLVLTFDDGYRENYDLLPLLERERVAITIFICSGIVGSNKAYWFTERKDAERLKELPDEARSQAIEDGKHAELARTPTRQALSDDEIMHMSGPLVDFQSHTVSHPILPRCGTEKAVREIARSRIHLEARYGLDVVALAYPNGDYSDRDLLLTEEAGYACGLTVDAGFNTLGTDRFRLKRICIDDRDGVDELLVKASGLWAVLTRLVRKKSHGYEGIGVSTEQACPSTGDHASRRR